MAEYKGAVYEKRSGESRVEISYSARNNEIK